MLKILSKSLMRKTKIVKDKIPADEAAISTVKPQDEATPAARTMKQMDEVSHTTEDTNQQLLNLVKSQERTTRGQKDDLLTRVPVMPASLIQK